MECGSPETQAVIARLLDRLTEAAEFEDQRAQEQKAMNRPFTARDHEGRAAGIRYALAEVRLYVEPAAQEQGGSA